MQYSDLLYGDEEINEPVLIEIIKSPTIQRLKGLNQSGLPHQYPMRQTFSRFDHSLGVMLLLKRLGAPLEEQIAGLVHDASHTAFSHLIDWIVGEGGDETYQDEVKESYLRDSEILQILKSYGYELESITDEKRYSLLEQPSPLLCADRVDYSLRELDSEKASSIIKSMIVVENKIVLDSLDSALLFANEFLRLQVEHWGGNEALPRYYITADLLKQALIEGIVTLEDFWGNDEEVINKVKSTKEKRIHEILSILEVPTLEALPLGEQRVFKKFRYIDPPVLIKGEVKKLSDLDPEFLKLLDQRRLENQMGIALPKY